MSIESFSELLGYTSICCWLGAQFPQIVENMKRKSCESLALPFLFNWMLGDASNLIGCILTHQLPFQTYLATYFCLIDCCLLLQYFYYGGGPKVPPISYPHARSRTTSSARGLSVDASHYRSISAAPGNIATAAALTAHSDTHPEHRRPRKHGREPSIDDISVPPYPSEESPDEATPSALSESHLSESGQRKRISWSQERQDWPSGVSSTRRRMSPVVSTNQRLSSTAAAALLVRGRSMQRDAEAEGLDDEQVETERRNASKASRRSVGMVMLGIGALFGVGRYTGNVPPSVGRGAKTGTVLVPTSDLDQPSFSGLPIVEGLPNGVADPPPSSINVVVPVLPKEDLFDQQRQPDEDATFDRVVGRIFAWICTTLYLTSRLPQIWRNYVRKSVEGLSMYLFVFAFLGNFFYVLSIITSHDALLPPPASTEFYRESLPYLLGSAGTLIFDITIVSQSFVYKGKHPRRGVVRNRGDSLVRSAALAEETAGLLRGDTLAASRARSSSVSVPHSHSRS